jgi:hypothetical protein
LLTDRCSGFNANVRFRYVRDGGKVPGVLHACQESRAEFLEKTNGKPDRTLARRRAAHPVHKLHFIDPARPRQLRRPIRTTSPVFFSVDHDIFWGTRYSYFHPDKSRQLPSWDISSISALDIASGLKHLVINYKHSHGQGDIDVSIEFTMRQFPNLESLTLLMPDKYSTLWLRNQRAIRKGAEVDGQLSTDSLSEADQGWLKEIRDMYDRAWDGFQKRHPGRALPVVKFRFQSQFVENEGILIPTPSKHPLAEFDF